MSSTLFPLILRYFVPLLGQKQKKRRDLSLVKLTKQKSWNGDRVTKKKEKKEYSIRLPSWFQLAEIIQSNLIIDLANDDGNDCLEFFTKNKI